MTTTPQAPELTSNESRMLQLLAMLPAPYRVSGGLDVRPAQKFWTTMSEHLGATRNMEGEINRGAVHAGALIEECLIAIRTGTYKNLQSCSRTGREQTYRHPGS